MEEYAKWQEVTALQFGNNDTKEEKKEEKKEEEKTDPYDSDLPVSKVLGDDMYPCMVGMCGSAFGFMKV